MKLLGLNRPLFLFEANEDDGQEAELQPLEDIESPIHRALERDRRSQEALPVEDFEQEEQTPQEQQKLFLGKFKTEEDAQKAHSELETFWHNYHDKVGQLDQPETEEQEYDPFQALRDANLAGFSPQDPDGWESLAELIGDNPRNAAAFVLRNHQVFQATPEVIPFVLDKWASAEPARYNAWYYQQREAALVNQFRELIQPAVMDVNQRTLNDAFDTARNGYEYFIAAEEDMKNYITTTPGLFTEDDLESREKLDEGLRRVYAYTLGQAMVNNNGVNPYASSFQKEEEEQAPARVQKVKPAAQRTTTARRQVAPRKTASETGEDKSEAIRAMIRSGGMG